MISGLLRLSLGLSAPTLTARLEKRSSAPSKHRPAKITKYLVPIQHSCLLCVQKKSRQKARSENLVNYSLTRFSTASAVEKKITDGRAWKNRWFWICLATHSFSRRGEKETKKGNSPDVQRLPIFARAASRICFSRAVRLWIPWAEILSRMGSTSRLINSSGGISSASSGLPRSQGAAPGRTLTSWRGRRRGPKRLRTRRADGHWVIPRSKGK